MHDSVGVVLTGVFEKHYEDIESSNEDVRYSLEVLNSKVAIFAETKTISNHQIGYLLSDDDVDLRKWLSEDEHTIEITEVSEDSEFFVQYDYLLKKV